MANIEMDGYVYRCAHIYVCIRFWYPISTIVFKACLEFFVLHSVFMLKITFVLPMFYIHSILLKMVETEKAEVVRG